jgi:hypothetical protein
MRRYPGVMTRAEAERECARLAAEHPDRMTHSWFPRRGPEGTWSVAKIGIPPLESSNTAETRADEKPPTADDPRAPAWRDTGGPHVGPG